MEIKGKVFAASDLEGIHIINKTSKYFTTTRDTGEFVINVKLNDTLVFSSVQYKLHSIKISQEVISNKIITVLLVEHVNQLDEVFVGNTLSGNLEDDIKSNKGNPDINFYDVGIPGYTGKPKTINERRLIEADHGKYFAFYGIGFAINVNKILNKVSGRTDRLKYRVELDKKDELMFNLKMKFSEDLFSIHNLDEEKRMDFFFFCSDSENFVETFIESNDIAILEFLEQKLNQYKLNNEITD